MITKYIAHLRSLSSQNLGESEAEEKKRTTVKKICDLKVKLNKLKEEAELEGAIRERKTSNRSDDIRLVDEMSPEGVLLYFQRTYTFTKHVGGHKLVPSNDIYENEKRFRSMCRSGHSTPSTGLSMSPSTAGTTMPQAAAASSQSQATLKLYQIMNNTTSYISYLTSACASWANSGAQPTNPFANLVCDCCLKRANKSLNTYIMEAFKFTRRIETTPTLGTSVGGEDTAGSNPYLVCIYCFYTVHLSCLNQDIRKCPKLYFDCLEVDLGTLPSCFFFNLTGNYTEETFKYDTLVPQQQPSSASSARRVAKIDPNEMRCNRVILKISPEVGLAKQDFRCVECKIPLSPSPPKVAGAAAGAADISRPNVSRPRLCDYFGLYFCENCHLGDTAIIPARALHNWDFRPHSVSRAALQIISYLRNTAFHFDRPVLFNLVDLNPMLFGLVDELIQIKVIVVFCGHNVLMPNFITFGAETSQPAGSHLQVHLAVSTAEQTATLAGDHVPGGTTPAR